MSVGSICCSSVGLALFSAYRKIAQHFPFISKGKLFLGMALSWIPRNCCEQNKAETKCRETDDIWGYADCWFSSYCLCWDGPGLFLLWGETLKCTYVAVFHRPVHTKCSSIAARLWNEIILHCMSCSKLFLFQPDLGLFWKKLELDNVKPKSVPFHFFLLVCL